MSIITTIKKYIKDRETNRSRDRQVKTGEFTYFIVKEFSSTRRKTDDGDVIKYCSRYAAEEYCDIDESVVSIATYDRAFGRWVFGKGWEY